MVPTGTDHLLDELCGGNRRLYHDQYGQSIALIIGSQNSNSTNGSLSSRCLRNIGRREIS